MAALLPPRILPHPGGGILRDPEEFPSLGGRGKGRGNPKHFGRGFLRHDTSSLQSFEEYLLKRMEECLIPMKDPGGYDYELHLQ